MNDVLISTLSEIRSNYNCLNENEEPYYRALSEAIRLISACQWIPIRTRPMTEEEREYWEANTGVELEDEYAVFFDCQMPDDGQEIWVCYKSGIVSEDVCERDDFCGLEGNGDWLDIVAWMPRIKPEPYREGVNNDG